MKNNPLEINNTIQSIAFSEAEYNDIPEFLKLGKTYENYTKDFDDDQIIINKNYTDDSFKLLDKFGNLDRNTKLESLEGITNPKEYAAAVLRNKLKSAEIPDEIVLLEKMPLNSNNKLDKNKLLKLIKK